MVQKNEDSFIRVGQAEDVIATLEKLKDSVVVVSVSSLGIVRRGYHTQMSIEGVLDVHPSVEGQYRVCTEDAVSYFSHKDVFAITQSGDVIIHIGISFEGTPFDAFNEIVAAMEEFGVEDDVKEAIRQILEAEEAGDS